MPTRVLLRARSGRGFSNARTTPQTMKNIGRSVKSQNQYSLISDWVVLHINRTSATSFLGFSRFAHAMHQHLENLYERHMQFVQKKKRKENAKVRFT